MLSKEVDCPPAGAEFSKDRKYRYVLWRIWDSSKKVAMCIGLNPSTANADRNDPTITFLIKVLRHHGYGGLRMVNLYGMVTPNPQDLDIEPNPYGDNDAWLKTTALISQEIIFCWGAFKAAKSRGALMQSLFSNAKCFGANIDGSPKHPMAYQRRGDKPEDVPIVNY